MSWGEYLSNLQRDGLKHAAICGLDGASWIQVTDGSNIAQAELASLLSSLGKVDALASGGIKLGGEKYMYISGSDSICRGKKGTGGVHCAKSKTTLVVGIYDDSIQPGQAATVVERMADYLSENNC